MKARQTAEVEKLRNTMLPVPDRSRGNRAPGFGTDPLSEYIFLQLYHFVRGNRGRKALCFPDIHETGIYVKTDRTELFYETTYLECLTGKS